MRIIFDSGVLYKIGSDRALRSLAQQGVFNGTSHVWKGSRWISLNDYLKLPPPLPRQRGMESNTNEVLFPEHVIACAYCSQLVRVPLATSNLQLRCPECKNLMAMISLEGGSVQFSFQNNMYSAFAPHSHITNRSQALRVLQLPNDASMQQIKKAYRNRMQMCHPDKVQNLAEEIKEVANRLARHLNEAFNILSKE